MPRLQCSKFFHIGNMNKILIYFIHVSGLKSVDVVSRRVTFSLCQCVNVCVCLCVCVCVCVDSHLRPTICLNARTNRHKDQLRQLCNATGNMLLIWESEPGINSRLMRINWLDFETDLFVCGRISGAILW